MVVSAGGGHKSSSGGHQRGVLCSFVGSGRLGGERFGQDYAMTSSYCERTVRTACTQSVHGGCRRSPHNHVPVNDEETVEQGACRIN
jgi:hypothetical protein